MRAINALAHRVHPHNQSERRATGHSGHPAALQARRSPRTSLAPLLHTDVEITTITLSARTRTTDETPRLTTSPRPHARCTRCPRTPAHPSLLWRRPTPRQTDSSRPCAREMGGEACPCRCSCAHARSTCDGRHVHQCMAVVARSGMGLAALRRIRSTTTTSSEPHGRAKLSRAVRPSAPPAWTGRAASATAASGSIGR